MSVLEAVKEYFEEQGVDAEELSTLDIDDTGEEFKFNGGEYIVYTDDEATEKAKECIEGTLGYFNASFIAGFTGFNEIIFDALCGDESNNEAIKDLIENSKSGHDFDDFVKEAIDTDGRGLFMSTYDDEEIELSDGLYMYRTN